MYNARSIVLFLVLVLPSAVSAQPAILHPDPSEKLTDRWDWAMRESKERGYDTSVWFGYSIARLMQEDSHIGSFKHPPDPDDVSLAEIIFGRKSQEPRSRISDKEALQKAVDRALKEFEDEGIYSPKTLKDLAILFQFGSHPGRFDRVTRIKVSNLDLSVDLENKPLLWLGQADDMESLELLDNMYEKLQETETKKRVVMAIGIHDASEKSIPIMSSILSEEDNHKVRKATVFWLGQTDKPKALSILEKVVHSDRSSEVRKNCVFAISQMDLDRATDSLIDLAQKSNDSKIRNAAIFWLGQKASKKAEAALQDIVYSGETTEVQEKAVFALTQLPESQGVPHLIRIAKSHPNVKVRKRAIFWLGQSHDPRALDTLIELIREK